jgi:hypothetical protein
MRSSTQKKPRQITTGARRTRTRREKVSKKPTKSEKIARLPVKANHIVAAIPSSNAR